MRRMIAGLLAISVASAVLYSCKKTSETVIPNTNAALETSQHGLGLNPMTPDQWANVPVFSTSLFTHKLQPDGLTYNGTAYSSYLLVTPQIRDQGQMGACTGFCGAETDEI